MDRQNKLEKENRPNQDPYYMKNNRYQNHHNNRHNQNRKDGKTWSKSKRRRLTLRQYSEYPPLYEYSRGMGRMFCRGIKMHKTVIDHINSVFFFVEYPKDDRMHRDRDNNPTQIHRTYTPLQFENSLGKLQVKLKRKTHFPTLGLIPSLHYKKRSWIFFFYRYKDYVET